MSYQFTTKCNEKSAIAIWQFIQNGLSNDVTIKTIKDRLPYTISYLTNKAISFSAPTRNDGEQEIIRFTDFVPVIESMKALQEFNTNSAKMFQGHKNLQETLTLLCLTILLWRN